MNSLRRTGNATAPFTAVRSASLPPKKVSSVSTETAAAPSEEPAETADRFGFSVQDLTPALREQLKVPAGTGVVVSGVEDDGPAAKAGLRAGDVIAEVNRERVRSAADFTRLLGQMRRGNNLLLLVQRDGNSRFVVVSPKQP